MTSGDVVVDVIRFELERDHFPVEEPDRLSILFVNAMNASPKLRAFAATKREPAAPDATKPPAP